MEINIPILITHIFQIDISISNQLFHILKLEEPWTHSSPEP